MTFSLAWPFHLVQMEASPTVLCWNPLVPLLVHGVTVFTPAHTSQGALEGGASELGSVPTHTHTAWHAGVAEGCSGKWWGPLCLVSCRARW